MHDDLNANAIVLTLQDRERDLSFVVRPMEPLQRESWYIRTLRHLLPKDAEITDEACREAVQSLLHSGSLGFFLRAADAQAAHELSNELYFCCWLLIEGEELPCTRECIEAFVEDVRTLLSLKRVALRHNLAFLPWVERALDFHARCSPGLEDEPAILQ